MAAGGRRAIARVYTLVVEDQNIPQWNSSVVEKRERAPTKSESWTMVLGVAGQIGWMIAVPAVLFVIGGAWLDAYFDTKPVLTLASIPLALTVSAISVWRVIKQLGRP